MSTPDPTGKQPLKSDLHPGIDIKLLVLFYGDRVAELSLPSGFESVRLLTYPDPTGTQPLESDLHPEIDIKLLILVLW